MWNRDPPGEGLQVLVDQISDRGERGVAVVAIGRRLVPDALTSTLVIAIGMGAEDRVVIGQSRPLHYLVGKQRAFLPGPVPIGAVVLVLVPVGCPTDDTRLDCQLAQHAEAAVAGLRRAVRG